MASTPANVPENKDTHRLEDKDLKGADLLPAAGLTTYGAEVSLSGLTAAAGLISKKGSHLEDMEAVLSLPAITLAALKNTETLTFSLMGDATAVVDAGSTVIAADFAVVTGATGTDPIPANNDVGRVKIPSDCEWPTIGLRCVAGAGTGDCSALNMTLSLAF